jgi:ribosomal protein S18 acetylase RimI-like enzyme
VRDIVADDVTYREMNPDELYRIAEIHLEVLPRDFSSFLGKEFLKEHFYPALFGSSDVALCALYRQQVVGYVLFSSDESLYRRLVMRNWATMLRFSLAHLVNIRFLKYIVEVFLLLAFQDSRLHGPELVYIGVVPEFQGGGVGSQLISRSIDSLEQAGFSSSWVKTLSSTPQNVRFYEKAGFKIVRTYLGRTYLKWAK